MPSATPSTHAASAMMIVSPMTSLRNSDPCAPIARRTPNSNRRASMPAITTLATPKLAMRRAPIATMDITRIVVLPIAWMESRTPTPEPTASSVPRRELRISSTAYCGSTSSFRSTCSRLIESFPNLSMRSLREPKTALMDCWARSCPMS